MGRRRRAQWGLSALILIGLGAAPLPAAAVGQSDYEVAGCTRADLGGRSVAAGVE